MLRLPPLEQHIAVRRDRDEGPVVDTLNKLAAGRFDEGDVVGEL